MGEYALGQAVPRWEDPRLLTGGGRYVDDVRLAGMVHGCVLRSPHGHARIRSLDDRAARQMEGVLAVLTAEDWAASGWRDIPTDRERKTRDGSPMFVTPFPALASERVRYVGDPVAFVVAETLDIAKDAAEAIEVDYAPLPAIVATEDAPKPGAPLVWDGCADNILFVHLGGDKAATDAAFERADRVVRRKFVINRITTNSMETRGCVAQYDRADERYTLHATLQFAHTLRAGIAAMMGVPESKVRVIGGDIGGGFGMKSGFLGEVPLCLLAAKQTGRPVRWVADRSEAHLSDPQARDNVTEGELALDQGGKFLALRVRTVANIGAYDMQGGANPPVVNLGTLAGVYTIGAIHVDVTGVLTNTHSTRPYRGAGRPEAAYVIERLIDLAADEIGVDPAELRRVNTIPPDALPYKTALTFTYDSGEFEKNMDMALELAGYAGFETRRADALKRGKYRGIGISNTIERAAAPGFEGAEIRFDRAGTVTLFAGSIDQGQGHETVFKQLVCDRLGIDPAQVQYVYGDTDQVAFGMGSAGSRSATLGGSAFLMATDKIIDKARRVAAHRLEAAVEDIEFADGTFTVAGTDRTIGIKEVARAAANPAHIPDDMEPGLVERAVYKASVQNFPNGCHVCELEIDAETGQVEIVDYAVIDDVGVVMNPLLLKGQIHGGVAMGVGQMLMEDVRYDETGQLLTGSFMDYCMPRADDFSDIKVGSNPVPTATNPLGVKGAGEAGCVGALPAVANALADALSPLGVSDVAMPATPETVWRAIRDATAGGAA